MGSLEAIALRLQLRRHAVERVDEPAELVRRTHRNAGVEVAARDAAGSASQPLDRIADALRHRQPDGGAEQDEGQSCQLNAAIELEDLTFDLLLARRDRHRQDGVRHAGAHGRCRDRVREVANRVLTYEPRLVFEDDRPIDGLWRSRRQKA